jgi:CPA2 family monovalent cation:H+ antiporter-2
VVLLLFIIGLELKPSRLWQIAARHFRARPDAGHGFRRRDLSAAGACRQPSDAWAAIAIGFGLALSSTAFGVQILEERGDLNTRYGQQSFSILLFQDIAIVPILALVPLDRTFQSPRAAARSIIDIAITVGAILALLVAGRYLLNPLFQ